MKKIIFLISLSLLVCTTWAQNIVSGKVTYKTEELIGVNISAIDIPGVGSVTDAKGNYSIKMPLGCTNLLFQYIGFENKTAQVCISKNQLISLDVSLKESSEVLGTVVVSAGKFEQRIEEVTVSMDVIKPSLIENKAAASIDKTINQAPLYI